MGPVGGFVIDQGEGGFPRGLAADLAELMLRAAADSAGEAAVQQHLARAARTGGLSMTFSNGYLRVDGEGDAELAFAALFDGLFEMLKEQRGLREARSILVDAASHLLIANPAEFLRSGVTSLLPPPVKVRLELTARRRLQGATEVSEEPDGETSSVGESAAQSRSVLPPGTLPEPDRAPAEQPPVFFESPQLPPAPDAPDDPDRERFVQMCSGISAIPPRRASRLYDSGYRSLPDIAAAPPEQIGGLTGWSLQVATEVRDAAGTAVRRSQDFPESGGSGSESVTSVPRTIEASEESGPAPPAPAVPQYPQPAPRTVEDRVESEPFDPYRPVIIRTAGEGKAVVETPGIAIVASKPGPTTVQPVAPSKVAQPATTTGSVPRLEVSGRAPPRRRTPRHRSATVIGAMLAVTVLLALVALTFFRIPGGPFEEYQGSQAVVYQDRDRSTATGPDLAAYGIATTPARTTFIFRLASAPSGPARLGVLADADGNNATGFRVLGAGAERRIEATLENRTVSALTALYDSTDDRNFTAWAPGGEMLARVSEDGKVVEIQTARIEPVATARAVFYVQSAGGIDTSDIAHAFTRGAIAAQFEDRTGGTVPAATNTLLGDLRLEAKGARATVAITASGSGIALDTPSIFDLEPDVIAVVPVGGLTSELAGKPLSATIVLSSADIAVDLAPIEFRAYARSAPATVAVDGAFADWDAQTGLKDPKESPKFPAQSDIGDYKGAREVSGSEVALYMMVAGSVLDGATVPLQALVLGGGGGGGGPVRLPRISGEDRVGFFIDVDGPGTGMPIGDIGADFLVEVHGIAAAPTKRLLSAFDPKSPDGWKPLGVKPRFAAAGSEAEFAVGYAALGVADGTRLRVIPFATAWTGELDYGDATLLTSGADASPSPRFWHARPMSSFAAPAVPVGDLVYPVRSAASADLDRDGLGDIAVGTTPTAASHLYLFRNLGGGPWGGPLDIGTAAEPATILAIAPGDLDNDGDLDLVVSNDQNDVRIYENPLNDPWNNAPADPFSGPWTRSPDIQTGGGPAVVRALTLADLDRDGDSDVIELAQNEMRIYRNPYYNGATPNDPFATAWGPTGGLGFLLVTLTAEGDDVSSGDLDRDGDFDLAVTTDAAIVSVWENPCDPSATACTTDPFANGWGFGVAVDLPAAGRGLALGDLDLDGDLDMVAGFTTDNSIRTMFRTGDPFGGAWTTTVIGTSPMDPTRVALADFDRDGVLDIVAGAGETAAAGRVLAWESERNPFSASGWTQVLDIEIADSGIGADNIVRGLAVSDYDLDGDADVGYARGSGPAVSDDAFIRANTLVHRNSPVRWGVTAGTNPNGLLGVDAGDFDRDGDLDLVTVGFGDPGLPTGNATFVYQNPGPAASTFAPWPAPNAVTTFASYEFLPDVEVADFDRDGWPDLAMHRQRTDSIRGVVAYRNDGSPFAGQWTGASGNGDVPGALGTVESTGIAAGDLDRDGRVDLVTTTNRLPSGAEPHGYVHAWRNTNPFNGAGSWSPTLIGNTSHRALDVQLGDLDGDGFLDIVVGAEGDGSDQGHWNLFAYRNPRPNPFGTGWTRHSAGLVAVGGSNQAVNSISISDLDRDGDRDVATVDTLGQVVAWENEGSPFAAPWPMTVAKSGGPSGISHRALDAQDMNNDGWDDLVAGDALGTVTVLRNGYSPFAGPWAIAQTYVANGSLRAIIARDLDNRNAGDEDMGDPEIVSVGFDLTGTQNPMPVRIDKNIGAMVTETASDVALANILPGDADDLIRVDVAHNGIAGDLDVEIDTWRFRFLDPSGGALSLAQMQANFDAFAVYLDSNSNGVWDPGVDVVEVASAPISAVTSNLVSLVVPESTGGAAARVPPPPGSGRTYLMVVQTDPSASLSFRCEFDPDGIGPSNYNEMNQNVSINGTEPVGTVVESPATLTKVVTVSAPELGSAAIAPLFAIYVLLARRARRKLRNVD